MTAAYTYNADDQLTAVSGAANASPASPFATISYQYNASSDVAQETDTGLPGSASQGYGYDSLNRLSSSGAGAYAYDAAGDPTQSPQGSQSFNSSEQVTSTTAAISLTGTSSAGDNGSSSSVTVSLPATAVPGDEILLAVTVPGNISVRSAPSGYALVGSYSTDSTSSGTAEYLYTHTVQAGDTSPAVTLSKAAIASATLLVYQGVNTSSPIDVSSHATATTATTLTLPSLTTTTGGDELVLAAGANSASAGTWTAPSGMTAEATQTAANSISAVAADQPLSTAGATGTRTATYSASGALAGLLVALRPAVTTYSYDAMGDRTAINAPSGTTTLSYDQLGRLTGYGTISYTYNGDGLRVAEQISRNSTQAFVWGSPGPGGVPPLLVDATSDYIYGPGGLPLEQISGSTVLYYLHDQLGSTRVLLNSSGTVAAMYSYDPDGNLTGKTGAADTPLRWAGQYQDENTGLYYLRHRYYDPLTGQFISVDLLADITQSPYGYTADNPLNDTDPTGMCGFWCWTAIGAAVIGTAACIIAEPCGIAEGGALALAGGGTAAIGFTGADIIAGGATVGGLLGAGGYTLASGNPGSSEGCPDQNFKNTGYSLDEIAEFARGHAGDDNPAMGRPSLDEIEAALQNGTESPGVGNSIRFDYNGVRVILNLDNPLRSTTYYPGR